MFRRALLFLWAIGVALGLSHCETQANPSHGGHPNPKSSPPGNKAGHANAKGGNANAKSSTPGNTGGHSNTANNPSTAKTTKHQSITFPQAAADLKHHEEQLHKDALAHKHKEWQKEKERHHRMQEERALLNKMEAELALLAQLLQQEGYHHHHHHALNTANTSNPYQPQTGQQLPYFQQSNGQQRPSQGQSASTGDQDSGQPPVAQADETPGNGHRHTQAEGALEYAEKLVQAAIKQMDKAIAHSGEHRRHHRAEARHLLDEAAQRSEHMAHAMRVHQRSHFEHPRMEAAPAHHRA
jgi:hypothetical protein